MLRSLRVICTALVLVAAACDSPRPSPTEPPAAIATVQPPPSPAAPVTTPEPTAEPTEPTALDRIVDAVVAGEISEAEGYRYRFLQMWGDPDLPADYQGRRQNDHVLGTIAETELGSMSAADQALLRPYLVRPTDPESYFTTASGPIPATAGRVATAPRFTSRAGGAAAALADDPRCGGGRWARDDMVNIPVTIWGHCGQRPDGSIELTMDGAMIEAKTAMTRLWPDMIGLMGPPIPDGFATGTRGSDEVPEAGDGRLDIYLVDAPNVTYGRNLDVTYSGAAASAAPPRRGTSWSGYIIAQPARAGRLLSVLAHELFHVIQMRYGMVGTVTCPYPNVTNACISNARTYHWFVEASAIWAEHEFIPEDRNGPYGMFERFLRRQRSMMETADENEYESWMWPLFMEQESQAGPVEIQQAWQAIEGKTGFLDTQAALDSVLKFTDHFRDFAVRLWNEQLPGDPINPRFKHPSLDPAFPPTKPPDVSPGRYVDEIRPIVDQAWEEPATLHELWAAYWRVTPPQGSGRLTFDFTGLQPNGRLDVDALVKVEERWERRELDPTVAELCLDTPDGRVQDLILVLSNHSQRPTDVIDGTWTAVAGASGCFTGGDGLVYTSVRTTGTPEDAFYQTVTETLTVRLSLKSSSTGFGLEDDGSSTWRGGVDLNGHIKGLPGCDTILESHGGGGGPISLDGGGVTASIFENTMTVAVSIPIDITGTMTSCAGTDVQVSGYTLTMADCEGAEVQGQGAGLAYEFNCGSQAAGWTWSVRGRITLNV